MNKLLELLGQNVDFSLEELAAMTGKTTAEVAAQLDELRTKGILKGKKTLINWDKVPDAGVRAIIELKVTPKPETGFDEVAKIVMSYDNVEDVYLAASSRYDLIALVNGSTIQEIAEFVAKRLSTLENVIGTATNFVLMTYKQGGVAFYEDEEDEEQRSLMF